MTQAAKSKMVKEIRDLVASVIANTKAYNVPSLCVRLGLADGTEEEAFASKFKYAQKRMAGVTAPRAIVIARELLAEEPSFALSEAIAKFDEVDGTEVTELTRRRLLAVFDGHPLSTELPEMDFLRKLWPIAQMPAIGFSNSLEEDIFQHTVRNDDWTNRELLEYLGILACSRTQLFRFLAAAVDPLAQTPERQAFLVSAINKHLQHDGYSLEVAGRISGSPRYEVRLRVRGSPADAGISAALSEFDPKDVHGRWTAALERRTVDPPGAITLARTLLEDVCKWILTEANEDFGDADDLPVLYKKLAKMLKLAPDDYTEKVFKQILGSCQSVVEALGALRNKLGDAHSLGPKRARPQARHAELAVNLSGAMATFLVSTWQTRQAEQKVTQKK